MITGMNFLTMFSLIAALVDLSLISLLCFLPIIAGKQTMARYLNKKQMEEYSHLSKKGFFQ